MKLTLITKMPEGWEILGVTEDPEAIRTIAEAATPRDSQTLVLTDVGEVAFTCFWYEGGSLNGPREWRLAVRQARSERGYES